MNALFNGTFNHKDKRTVSVFGSVLLVITLGWMTARCGAPPRIHYTGLFWMFFGLRLLDKITLDINPNSKLNNILAETMLMGWFSSLIWHKKVSNICKCSRVLFWNKYKLTFFLKTCAFGKCLKSNKWLMVKLLKNMHCNRLTTLYYQPIFCLSFPPGSPLFAFHSCTLPWYSHISSIAHHHRKAQELWDARSFDLLSWLFKFLFIYFSLSNVQWWTKTRVPIA